MSRRSVGLAIGVLCLAALLVPLVGAPPPPGPQPVSVVNFPAVQVVSGTVDVGNLPAVQEVAGTVAVGNLPLDQDGNVRVAGATACAAAAIHFVGFTQATFMEGTGALAMSRACDAEYSASRVCDGRELFRSTPPPPEIASGGALIIVEMERDTALGPVQSIFSTCTSSAGVVFDCPSQPYPVACCGY